MKNKIFHFTKEQVFEYAKEFFIEACGFDMQKAKHQKMLSEALEILDREKPKAELKAVCTKLGKDVFSERKVTVGDIQISCNGFSRINAENVLDVYICVVTAGNWHIEEAAKARHQVYMDTWGTAFADGAKVLMEEELKSGLSEGRFLSDPFGPGYYGMPSSDTHKFSQLLDMGAIDVDVRDSGIMVPLKSIAAIYLVTDNINVLPPMACSECFGKVEGCRYCEKRKVLG